MQISLEVGLINFSIFDAPSKPSLENQYCDPNQTSNLRLDFNCDLRPNNKNNNNNNSITIMKTVLRVYLLHDRSNKNFFFLQENFLDNFWSVGSGEVKVLNVNAKSSLKFWCRQNRKEKKEKNYFFLFVFFTIFTKRRCLLTKKNLFKKQKLNHQMHRERIFIITARFGCCQVWNNCLISRPLKTNTIIIIVQMWTISINLL